MHKGGNKKVKGFSGKIKWQEWGIALVEIKEKERRRKKEEIFFVFGDRVPLPALSASESLQKSKMIKHITSQTSCWIIRYMASDHLLRPGVVSPVSFFHKAAGLPFFLGSWYTFAIIMQPMIIRPITSKNLGRLRISTLRKRQLHLINLKIFRQCLLSTFNQ